MIPQQLDDVDLRETFKEGLKKKLKLASISMPRTTIIEVANFAREIEQEMLTPHKNRWSQPLLDNEDSDEELINDY